MNSDKWTSRLNRRKFLSLSATLTLAAPAVWNSNRAWASGQFGGETIRVLTWSGEVGEATAKHVFQPFEKATGAKIVADLTGATSEMVAKIKASASTPQYDLVMLSGVGAADLAAQGLLDKPDAAAIPNLLKGPEALRLSSDDHALAYLGSLGGLVYSSERVETTPTSWKALWDPKFVGRVFLPPPQWLEATFLMSIAAKLAGGSVADPAKGLEMLRELQPSVLTLGENPPQIAELFRSGSLDIGGPAGMLYFPGQIGESTYKMNIAYDLEEGFFYDPWAMVMPKGHPGNKAVATALANFALEAETQAQMAATLGVGTFNAEAKLTPEQLAKPGMVAPSLVASKGINVNTPEIAAVRAEWIKKYTEIFGM